MKPLKLAVLDQSVSLAGSSEDAAIRDTVSLAEHCERARLFALLAERAPRPADDRRQRARDPDGGDRRAHVDDPHRQRRRHAAALQRAEGRRAVPRPRGAGARPHRPRRRPRPRRRHAHGARAQPERRRGGRGLSGPGARPAGVDEHRPPCRHHGASARAARARDLDPGQLRLWRAARRPLRTAVLPSPISSPTARAQSRRSRCTGGSISRASAIPSRRRRFASGRSPRRATRKRAISRSRAIAGASIAAAASSGRCSRRTRSRRRGFDAAEEQGLASMRARAFVGSLQTVSEAIRAPCRGVRPRRGRDQHLGARPGGASHVVRAARRGVLAQRGAEPYVKRRQRYSSGP